jgi:anti-sigma factor RsiW
MDHLSETRLMELALDPASVPQSGEAAHLESCRECAALLAEERRLSELIESLPADRVPDDFTARTAERFEREGRKRLLKTLPWAVLACLVVLVPMIGIALVTPEPLFGSIARDLAAAAVFIRAVDTVVGNLPAVGLGLAGAMLVALLVGCGLLAGLVRRTAAVKYRGR